MCTRHAPPSLGGAHSSRSGAHAALYTLYLYTYCYECTDTGLLNALGGAYCFKAKSAIETKPAMPFAMMPAAVPAAMPVASAVPVQGQVIAPKM